MLSILLVEDNRDLALSVIDHLELEDIICDYAANGLEGSQLIERNSYDVIILDINMQGMDGLTLCKSIRSGGNDIPILMLTARDTLANKLEGFDAGTDDYMVKPFEIDELMVRLYALSRRRSGQVARLEVGAISLDLSRRTCLLNGSAIKTTPTAYKLLETLLRASPEPVSQADLFRKVWGDTIPDSNKLRVHIHHLRKLLSAGSAENLLKTVSGYGFCIAE